MDKAELLVWARRAALAMVLGAALMLRVAGATTAGTGIQTGRW
jgi:hypothetical protein